MTEKEKMIAGELYFANDPELFKESLQADDSPAERTGYCGS